MPELNEKLRVLFIDNEEVITRLGARMLASLGHEAVTMTNPAEALRLFRHRPENFDLVITDLAMPVMNGDDLARELLKIRPSVRLILCTGYDEAALTEGAGGFGVRAILTKPLTRAKLSEAIRLAMGYGNYPD